MTITRGLRSTGLSENGAALGMHTALMRAGHEGQAAQCRKAGLIRAGNRHYCPWMRPILVFLAALIAVLLQPAESRAQAREVPYWASIRAKVVNMRIGPSADYPIAWVYRRQGLPVKVVRVVEGWRLVRDPDGAQGWVVARLLDPQRGAIVIGKGLAAIREEPDPASRLKWNAQPGVVGTLGNCKAGWCEIDIAGRKGWILAARLWGPGEP